MTTQNSNDNSNPVVIKRYKNRKLYNTETSSYVTMLDIVSMVRNGQSVKVFSAVDGSDITSSILAGAINVLVSGDGTEESNELQFQLVNALQGLDALLAKNLNSSTQKTESVSQESGEKSSGGQNVEEETFNGGFSY